MLSIKDYIVLKNIFDYLDEQRNNEIRENNGYANECVDRLTDMKESLGNIIYKLEREG